MNTKTLLASIAATLLITQPGFASGKNPVHFKAPAYSGTGCPTGSADYSITPDGSTLSILFGRYEADAGNRSRDRKTCNISIPVRVPNGYQVSLITADYRGFVDLPKRSDSARLSRTYFFAGQLGFRKNNTFNGRSSKDYLVRDEMLATTGTWSACGRDVNMRINSSMMARGKNAYASVDTVDLKSDMKFHLQFRRCH